jgi:S-adenosyl-L-methionine hydrolase (adenosine-forming)
VSIITLLTDFGLKDPYVGIMKGVILSIGPDLTIVDISHEVEAQAVREGAFLIEEYYPYFGPGTVHVCVVDPTVGSSRKPLVVTKGDHTFVGPDNGLFTLVLGDGAVAREISNDRFTLPHVSGTFHGRDIFAPAAAHLACGTPPSESGPPVAEPVTLGNLHPSAEGEVMTGKIVRIDRFGNAISNVTIGSFSTFVGTSAFRIELAGLSFDTLNTSYYERRHTCLVGSSGYLEFGLFMGNLSKEESIDKGKTVKITRIARPA